MAKTVDPKQYQIYVDRQGSNYIDYQKITERANKLLTDEVDRRQGIKDDLDARANDLYDQLGTVEMNSDSKFSDQVLDAAAQLRKSLMADQKLLKSGAISVNEYKQQLERAKQQMSEWGAITKSFGDYKNNYNTRIKLDDETGEMIMAPDEAVIKESSLGFSYTYDKQIYVDPVTKNTYYYQPNDDGSIPDFNEEPDKFMAMSNARNRFQYENDRKQYDIGFQVNKEKDMLGTIVDSYVAKFKGMNRVGTYVMTETDYTVLETEGLLDEFVDTIYAKTSGTDRGLANSADVMGEFTIALSLEQFKKTCKGGEFCDEKYFIKVNPNDPSGMTFEFSDKDFVQERVKADIKSKANMQLGRKEEISSKAYDPNEDKVAGDRADEDLEFGSYFNDLKNLNGGNQTTFNAAERDLRERANRRLAAEDPENNNGRLETITRNENEFTFTFKDKNGVERTETVDRYEKKADGSYDREKPIDLKLIFQELNTKLRPEGFDDSFDTLEERALRSDKFKYEYDDGTDFSDESVETQKAFKTIQHTSFSDANKRATLDPDVSDKIVTYKNKLKIESDTAASGGGFKNQTAYFKSSIPRELNMAFQEYGITPPQFTIKGFDESGVDNSYFIEYMNPYTKPPVKETIQFKFDSAKNETSMNNWLNAMDEAVNKVVGAYNSSEGKSAAP